MYMADKDRQTLSEEIGRMGAPAVSLLAELAGDEASHPDSYAAGYLQGYAHGIDAAVYIVDHVDGV